MRKTKKSSKSESMISVTVPFEFNENTIVKPKIDVVFKKLFGSKENIHILKAFIACVLGIEKNRITDITIESSELIPEFADEKFGRVDIKCTIDNFITVNAELQALCYPDYKDRTLYYWSRLFTLGLKKGKKYGTLPQTVCINILGYNLFTDKSYHSLFKIKEENRNEILTDKFTVHFYELGKLPEKTDENADDPILQWLWLINAETKEELEMLANSNIPEIRDAVTVVKYFSKDEQMQWNAFQHEMAILDHAAELDAAIESGKKEAENEFKPQLDEANTKISELSTDNSKLSAENSELTNKISEQAAIIEKLQAQLDAFSSQR